MKRHIRADTHRHSTNAAKEAVVIRFVQDYRQVAKQIAKRQWRRLFETGATDKRKNDDKDLNPVIGAAPVQMARFQVAEQIDGWWANRANEFRTAVQRSSLDAETKHRLHLLNKWNAIHARGELCRATSWFGPKTAISADWPKTSCAVSVSAIATHS